jgi:hypothetical protein
MVNQKELQAANDRITALESKCDTLLRRIEALEADKAEKDKEIHQLKNNNPNTADLNAAEFWSKLSPAATTVISNIAQKENHEQKKREKNMIVSGIPESQQTEISEKNKEDKVKFMELLTKIGIDEDEEDLKTIRLKSKAGTNKPGPLLIVCDSLELKMEILKAAKKLREIADCREVYINNDMTIAQMEQEKKLRLERNEKNKALEFTGDNNLKYGRQIFADGKESKYYWGIRSGEFRKIKFL